LFIFVLFQAIFSANLTAARKYHSKPLSASLSWLVFLCFLTFSSSRAQSTSREIASIPASIEEADINFPLFSKWKLSAQVDMQLVTQGAYTNSNPFAYVQRLVFRPWLIYSGFKHMTFYLGYARNKKYAIQEAGTPEILERRLILMGTYMQTLPKGSIFEQVRFETKFFDDQNGVHRVIPRLRARVGVNHFLREKPHARLKSQNISYYTEIMFKFAPKDYAEERFDILRQSVYYSAGLTKNLHILTGIIGQIQLRSNGHQYDVYYGPTLALKWNVRPKARETFDAIDGGAD
jgi:hypothetical protein